MKNEAVPSEVQECVEQMIHTLEHKITISTSPTVYEMLPPRPPRIESVPPELVRFRQLWAARSADRAEALAPAKRNKRRYKDGVLEHYCEGHGGRWCACDGGPGAHAD